MGILERDGIRIGILGLIDRTAEEPAALAGQATIQDPTTVAARYVAQVRPQVDLLIVLSRLGLAADQDLARAVSGIDVIVGGNTDELMDTPLQIGNTLIVQQGYRGEWFGLLHASFSAEGVPADATEQSIALTDAFADDPDMVARVNHWIEAYPEPTLQP
jgi:2',3'-cyclic-nucleotide 2'-phosphodiesterase (5'-nucleotidase family)